jgi:four helix bundle protein
MSESTVKSFEELQCWQACRHLRYFVRRKIVPIMPKEEVYRLSDQITRSSRSTTANIAEGYGRFHYLDNAKFCSNSRGSCWETLDHLITANDDGLIDDELLHQGRELVNSAVKLTNGYISYLQRAAKSQQ